MAEYAQFAPRYLQLGELQSFGLPMDDEVPEIMNLVEMASLIIDEDCGRIDGDGNGSLVVTTWAHRCLLQTRGRNLVECPQKPMMAVTPALQAQLQASASGTYNTTYTGVQANVIVSNLNGMLSPIIGCSGRFGYGRQTYAAAYPDFGAFINPLTFLAVCGGPVPWVPIDVSMIDFDPLTGELWIPAGLILGQYSEVLLVYNSGFNPLRMPRMVKQVCASVLKNALASGNATTFLTGMSLAKSGANYSFGGSILDPRLSAMLSPFRNVRSY